MANAGARAGVVPLAPPGFRLDPAALERAVTPRTRAIVLNSPHNPAGQVFSRAELEAVAEICWRTTCWSVTDEVYEHLVFDGRARAARVAARDARADRDDLVGREDLQPHRLEGRLELRAARRSRPRCGPPTSSSPSASRRPSSTRWPPRWPRATTYYAGSRPSTGSGATGCATGSPTVGFACRPPEGTYFALADIRPLGYDDEVAFCRTLVERVGVAAIPASAFAAGKRVRHLVRFAFCKDDATLEEGLRRLRRLKG